LGVPDDTRVLPLIALLDPLKRLVDGPVLLVTRNHLDPAALLVFEDGEVP